MTEAHLALFVPPPSEALASRRLTAEAAALYGILWDQRTDHWILPIRDARGVLMGWQEKGKRFFCNRPDGVKKSRTLFGAHLLDVDTAVLVESPLDAALMASLGIEGAVASYGAYVSDAQMRLIKHHVRHLVLALDNDTAGNQSRDKLYARWRPRGLPISYFNYEACEGKDAGELSDEQILIGVHCSRAPWRTR